MSEINVKIKDLLEAGCHFGHQTQRKNPNMDKYIYVEKNGISIIDVRKTLTALADATDAIKRVVASGGNILFVGTKKQGKSIVKESAEKCGMPFVSERWLGGMLTNQKTILKSVGKIELFEDILKSDDNSMYTKKELSFMSKKKEKIERNLSGVKDLRTEPDMIFIIDIISENTALSEARKLKIPVVALVDSNCDAKMVDYPIPSNDDAMKSIKIICDVIVEAVLDAKNVGSKEDAKVEKAEEEEVKEKADKKAEEK